MFKLNGLYFYLGNIITSSPNKISRVGSADLERRCWYHSRARHQIHVVFFVPFAIALRSDEWDSDEFYFQLDKRRTHIQYKFGEEFRSCLSPQMTGLTFALFPVERYLIRYANVIMTLAIAATTGSRILSHEGGDTISRG